MKVTLLSWTPDALDLLILTKENRLSAGEAMKKVEQMTQEEKEQHLNYMLGTIQSSWEFVDYVFLIEGVSRAFTHQFVRTRHGSFAQQSQRTVDMSGFEFVYPEAVIAKGESLIAKFDHFLGEIDTFYEYIQRHDGVAPQDARSILPTNIETNIIGKFSLRTLSEMAKIRLCTRTQGEYQNVFRAMRETVINIHPWAEPFIEVHCVALGVCAFPNFMECPIKGMVFNPEDGQRWDLEATVRMITINPNPTNELTKPMTITTSIPAKPGTREQIKLKWQNTHYEAIPEGSK